MKPAMAAVAGLVPWAESGTMIFVRPVSPRAVVVGLDEQKAGEFAMGAGSGLEGHGVHAGDLAEQLLGDSGRPGALDGVGGLEGVEAGEAGQGGGLFIELGVVLHGAGAQGVEAVAHAEGTAGQGLIVAGQVVLPQLWQCGGLSSAGTPPGGAAAGTSRVRQEGAFPRPGWLSSKISFICPAPP